MYAISFDLDTEILQRSDTIDVVSSQLTVQELTLAFDWFAPPVRDIRMLRIEDNNDPRPAIDMAPRLQSHRPVARGWRARRQAIAIAVEENPDMRFAAIADIHGNALALEAVLADIAARGIDGIVNLGDVASGPLEARRTLERLMPLELPTIRGNHDRWLVEQPRESMGASDRAAFDELSPAHLAWLGRLPPTLVHASEVLLCHGTPASDIAYWLEEVSPDGIVHQAPLAHIERHALGFDFPLILCGHTHLARIARLPDGRLIVNPGSVGCPGYEDDTPVPHRVEAGSPDARYAILEKVGGGWTAALRHVRYDHAAMAGLARRRGRHEWASALATGWTR